MRFPIVLAALVLAAAAPPPAATPPAAIPATASHATAPPPVATRLAATPPAATSPAATSPVATPPAPPAQPRSLDWRQTDERIQAQLQEGAFAAALPVIRAALAKCPDAISPSEAALCRASLSLRLGAAEEHAGNLSAAEAAFREAVAARVSVLAPTDPLIGQADALLAAFYQRHGRPADEIAALTPAENIAAAAGPGARAQLAVLLTRHAQALDKLDQPAAALPLYRRAYVLAAAAGGLTSANALAALGNLFTARVSAGNGPAAIQSLIALLASPEASDLDPTQRAMLTGRLAVAVASTDQMRQALALTEKALPDLDNSLVVDPDASYLLLRGASRLQLMVGQPARALALARRARTVAARAFGQDSVAVTHALRQEAEAEAASHHLPAAIGLLDEALATPDTPGQLLLRTQLIMARATLLQSEGQGAQAIASLTHLVASPVFARATPPARAATLTLAGEALSALGARNRAARACAEATALADGPVRVAPEFRIKALVCSGNLALAAQQPDHALDFAARADDVLRLALPAISLQRRILSLPVVALRARALRDAGRDQEALAAYRTAVTDAHAAGDTGVESVMLAETAFLQRQMGLLRESDATSLRALAVLGTAGSPETRADLLNNRALVAEAEGRFAEAVPLLRASIALRRGESAPAQLSIGAAERDLAMALAEQGHDVAAGRHMDKAIAIFRALGPNRQAFLTVALDRRAAIASAAGDLPAEESALRSLLPLRAADPDALATTRLALAALLDNEARHSAAADQRAEAIAGLAARHGVHSVAVWQARLATQPSLLARGQLAEAARLDAACLHAAASLPASVIAARLNHARTQSATPKGVSPGEHPPVSLRLSCLMAQGETALAGGDARAAATAGARAVRLAETDWTQQQAPLLRALMLRVHAEAALGDSDAVLRLYDRVHALTPPANRRWTDIGEGRALIQAGAPDLGLHLLHRALDHAIEAHQGAQAVAAATTLAQHLESTGKTPAAIDLWRSVLPLLPPHPTVERVALLQGLGDAANATARYDDAARFLGHAARMARATLGAGSPDYLQLVVKWSDALAHANAVDTALTVLRRLDGNDSPAARRQQTIGLLHLAQTAGDPAAARMLSREVAEQADVAFGAHSVAAAFAHLDRMQLLLSNDRPIDPDALTATIRRIEAADPGWQVAVRIARFRGAYDAHFGRWHSAMAAFRTAEALERTHAGPDSLQVADAVANQAGIALKTHDIAAANRLFNRALRIAAPAGDWHNPVWANIAAAAAVAAARGGDTARASQLRRKADALTPAVSHTEIMRWS